MDGIVERMSRTSAIVIAILALALAAGIAWYRDWFYVSTAVPAPEPVSQSEMGAEATSSVVVKQPLAGSTIADPFQISGKARGTWFFEASFPVQLRDADGNVLGRSVAQAQGEWMTADFVPFTAQMKIDTPYHGPATLILMKDNPSGLPENDDAVEVPVMIQ